MGWHLQTARLNIRSIDMTDAANLLGLNQDPEVMKYLGKEFDTLEGAKEILPKIVARNEKYQNQLGLFAAIEKASGEFIGWFIMRPNRENPEDTSDLETGYRLHKRFWGMGYATEGAKALVDQAVRTFHPRRIYGEAMVENRASIHVLEKLGLRFERQFSEPYHLGGTCEIVVYSRELRSEVSK